MTDMTRDQAIEIVARRILVTAGSQPQWADYPEISRDDWHTIQTRVDQIARLTSPSADDYPAAYGVLASRAEWGGDRG